jgi:hypothetical protein
LFFKTTKGGNVVPNQFLVITDESGNLLDSHLQRNVNTAMGGAFDVQDVFVYSHGWWTSAEMATEVYNRFSIEFAANALPLTAILPPAAAFAVGVHWPSMLSENPDSLENYAEALSYFGMANRADAVGSSAGFSLLRMLLGSRQSDTAPLRLHLIGHSFGCKVVCMALQRLVDKGIVASNGLKNVSINVALIQAAFNNDELEDKPIADYQNVISGVPGLRMLITTSSLDNALNIQFKRAQGLANLFNRGRDALGASGPTQATVDEFGGKQALTLSTDFTFQNAPALGNQKLVVADLTAVHQANVNYQADAGLSDLAFAFSGHHSDIYLPPLYQLLLAFFFKSGS